MTYRFSFELNPHHNSNWCRRKMTCKKSGMLHLCILPNLRKLQFKVRYVKCYCKVENSAFTWQCEEDTTKEGLPSEGTILLDENITQVVKITPKFAKNKTVEFQYLYFEIQHKELRLMFKAENSEEGWLWKHCIQWCTLGFEKVEQRTMVNVERSFAANQFRITET